MPSAGRDIQAGMPHALTSSSGWAESIASPTPNATAASDTLSGPTPTTMPDLPAQVTSQSHGTTTVGIFTCTETRRPVAPPNVSVIDAP